MTYFDVELPATLKFTVRAEDEPTARRLAEGLLELNTEPDGTITVDMLAGWDRGKLLVDAPLAQLTPTETIEEAPF